MQIWANCLCISYFQALKQYRKDSPASFFPCSSKYFSMMRRITCTLFSDLCMWWILIYIWPTTINNNVLNVHIVLFKNMHFAFTDFDWNIHALMKTITSFLCLECKWKKENHKRSRLDSNMWLCQRLNHIAYPIRLLYPDSLRI